MKFPSLHNKQFLFIGIALIFIALAGDTILNGLVEKIYTRYEVFIARTSLEKKLKSGADLLQQANAKGLENLMHESEYFYKTAIEAGVYFYAYSANRVLFWTDNSVFPKEVLGNQNATLTQLDNGYYVQRELQGRDAIYVILIPVKFSFDFENQYLSNSFQLAQSRIINFDVSPIKDADGYEFKNEKDDFLFSIKPILPIKKIKLWSWIFLIGFLMCLVFVNQIILGLLRNKNQWQGVGAFALTIMVIVVFWKWIRLPESLFSRQLFNPQLYASSNLLRSLGDLLIFTLLLGWGVWILTKIKSPSQKNQRTINVTTGLSFALVFTLSSYIQGIIRGLVFDSSISFDLGNVFGLNYYSFCGLFIIGILLLSLAIIIINATRYVIENNIPASRQILIGFVAGLASVVVLYPTGHFLYASFLFSPFLYLLIYYLQQKDVQLTDLRPAGYISIFYAVYTSVLLLYYNGQKLKEHQKILASELISERDLAAEFLFGDVYENIRNDGYAKSFFYTALISQASLSKRIEQLYFSGYLSKYDVEIFTFSFTGMPFKGNPDKPLDFFSGFMSTESSTRARGNYLFFVNTYSGLPTYISKIDITHKGRNLGSLVLLFHQKAFYEESVYPELFLSDKIRRYNKLDEYSYAIYNETKLVTQKGEYAYPTFLKAPFVSQNQMHSANLDGFVHHVYHTAPGQVIVISDKEKGVLYYSANFSFILIFFGLFALVIISMNILLRNYILYFRLRKSLQDLLEKIQWKNITFRTRILSTITISMTLALLVVGFTTIKYISYRYNNDELIRLNKKARSIVANLEGIMKNNEPFHFMSDDEKTAIIKNLSGSYQTDINLFDTKGNLMATSQPLIYDKKILQPKMNASARIALRAGLQSRVMQEENIGKLNYLSTYLPVHNGNNQIEAYLNLPFFTREKQLNDDISSFLVALVNIYMFMFVAFLAISVLIANTLTAPLNIIRKHLSTTRLNSANELISWDNNDEIGKLIHEYNSMIIELEESVQRLSESEREGAWKEMAKQVAHEIKNPLTPMKLNVQQLQLAWKEKDPRLDAMFDKVTNLIIRQIESLSQIATEFSNFAKMPHDLPEKVELNSAIQQAAELFFNQNEAEIILQLSQNPIYIWIDPNQFSRVMNNLIKNAIQAIPENKKGEIVISCFVENDKAFIKIKDNGTGIADSLKEKIFIPNFSTKTSGMGLGLAIIKNIITAAKGQIYFETEPEVGTEFTILFPVVNS
ncbi:MAG: ATP-binding protein [Bacteroidetes bacterium]|nr:ATP-binding protein [Bacteroidota bacterium]